MQDTAVNCEFPALPRSAPQAHASHAPVGDNTKTAAECVKEAAKSVSLASTFTDVVQPVTNRLLVSC